MQASAEKVWAAAQEHLRSRLSPDTYNLWFAPLRAAAQDHNSIVLEVANDFCEVWLKDNYVGLLQDVIGVVSGKQLQIKFRVAPSSTPILNPNHAPAPKAKAAEPAAERPSTGQEPSFNPKNTFETFVV